MRESLDFWVIYFNPSDYPGKYFIRKQSVVKASPSSRAEIIPSPVGTLHDTLEEAHEALPKHLFPLGRMEGDDPAIVEVWI